MVFRRGYRLRWCYEIKARTAVNVSRSVAHEAFAGRRLWRGTTVWASWLLAALPVCGVVGIIATGTVCGNDVADGRSFCDGHGRRMVPMMAAIAPIRVHRSVVRTVAVYAADTDSQSRLAAILARNRT